MKKGIISAVILVVLSCSSYELKEPHKSDYSTKGPLGNNCFQIIVSALPESGLKAMAFQRESAYIKARRNIRSETGEQIFRYYLQNKKIIPDAGNKSDMLNFFEKYSERGRIVEEFYKEDNSAVIIFRIFSSDIKNKILAY